MATEKEHRVQPDGPSPLRRAVAGLVLGALTGLAVAALLPRDRRPSGATPAR